MEQDEYRLLLSTFSHSSLLEPKQQLGFIQDLFWVSLPYWLQRIQQTAAGEELWDGGWFEKAPKMCICENALLTFGWGKVKPPAVKTTCYSPRHKSVIYCFQTGKFWEFEISSESHRKLLNPGNISWFKILQLVSLFNLIPLLFSPSSDHSSGQSHSMIFDAWPTGIHALARSLRNEGVSWELQPPRESPTWPGVTQLQQRE